MTEIFRETFCGTNKLKDIALLKISNGESSVLGFLVPKCMVNAKHVSFCIFYTCLQFESEKQTFSSNDGCLQNENRIYYKEVKIILTQKIREKLSRNKRISNDPGSEVSNKPNKSISRCEYKKYSSSLASNTKNQSYSRWYTLFSESNLWNKKWESNRKTIVRIDTKSHACKKSDDYQL